MATGLLLAACSGGGGGDKDDGTAKPAGSGPTGSEGATASADTRSSPAPSPTSSASAAVLDFTPDPGRAPKTRAEALRLARAVAAEPADWGPGFVKRNPYESDPGFWPVLNAKCVWQREPLPATVLASLTRYSELPAEDGKGPIRIAAAVTVHKTATAADWEMAETLEEALRCPDQQLRQGERISDLFSQASAFGLLGNINSEDTLTESGKYYSDELGGPLYYYWMQNRLAQVTMAVVGRGAKGRTDEEVDAAMLQGVGRMLSLAESELEAPE
ncbi:hypothetical protein [Streptomyces sp. NBC_00878]|uniref:hypothetical protein n=1 Tax=Streptomyces sp. NBC_00878 TaxID=2975854 RepID=UPI00225BD759|nr:hypothetical protein [Streptomyces sp. NBC_00878]MCX4908412.1 hypothetical protein [Streptomyces sp. NBC_00878]